MHSTQLRSPAHAIGLTLAIVLGAAAFPARAQTSITYLLGTVFSPDPVVAHPDSSPPWLTATFTNDGSYGGVNHTGQVQLTMTVSDLPTSEFVSDWLFNIVPAKNPADLQFTLVGAAPGVLPSIGHTTNAYMADGDGKYDIKFSFAASGGHGGADRFTANEMFTYNIVLPGDSTLTASDFYTLSAPAGGHGPYYVAAHIQGIPDSMGGTSNSDWLTAIPEPSGSTAILGFCAGVLAIIQKIRRERTPIRA